MGNFEPTAAWYATLSRSMHRARPEKTKTNVSRTSVLQNNRRKRTKVGYFDGQIRADETVARGKVAVHQVLLFEVRHPGCDLRGSKDQR
jgi:hypothetical protein